MLNKVYKEYAIDNYIVNSREIFDGTYTFDRVMMCQWNEYFKGNSSFTNKSFSIFPYKGSDSLGFLIDVNNQIQC